MSDKKRMPDDFWDLSSLLPRKRPAVMQQRRPDTEPVDVNIDAPESGRDGDSPHLSIGNLASRFREVKVGENKTEKKASAESISISVDPPSSSATEYRAALNRPKGSPTGSTTGAYGSRSIPRRDEAARTPRPTAEPTLEYEPEDSLIRSVRIMRWPTSYTFYEQFRSDAHRCRNAEGKPSPKVDFFSYTPQYRQMSQAQLDYYFYWRSLTRLGVFEPTDFSYILLYIYEIINLNDSIDTKIGLDMLTELWLRYRDPHKALDKYLSEWLADYCLIHRLPPPREKLSPIMHVIMENTSFREFYMTGDVLDPKTLIALSSNYSWQKSKYASADSPEARALYEKHIPEALGYVIKNTADSHFNVTDMTPARASRDAFCGSLCSHNIKRRIDVQYFSYTRSADLRALITDIVKYSENKLRAHLSVKSRLRVENLDVKIKNALDDYFASVFPEDRRQSRRSEEAEEERYYNAMYGALSVGVDVGEAQKIEAVSWSITDRLTAGEDDTSSDAAEMPVAEEFPSAAPQASGDVESDTDADTAAPVSFPETEEESGALPSLAVRYLAAVRSKDYSAAEALCRKENRYADELAEIINNYAVDTVGDIFLEPDERGGYTVIEDYEAEIDDVIKSLYGSDR